MSAQPKTAVAAPTPIPTTSAGILDLTIAGNRISANASDVNAYGVRNELLLKQEKARVRYKNGETLPTSAEVLLANANRKDYNHRRTLSRNIVAATAQPRPANTCAHHIVALGDPEARESRNLLYGWGIGINDADNGVFLPRKGPGMPDYPNATHHTPSHKQLYHLEVYSQLSLRDGSEDGRRGLRSLKSQLLSGELSL
ncbi:AHH domain-containing protein [Dyella nitratireducens]|uniref:Uncharacterized protein n=1 Tax=Dyella nitratireducens TaxID=1849580 RepID=A0ABQ1G599_9GAMM|nr:AHH domain-containing protein [Dyella nitratireducens]GGA37355.1 hypothetical protein GCM10010981_28120 [Dyella nitratireducens]GLQ41190.1 hypothetical protein GCM10007902_10400 [Dyella nitratireducens]